jgi:hypothetical protein
MTAHRIAYDLQAKWVSRAVLGRTQVFRPSCTCDADFPWVDDETLARGYGSRHVFAAGGAA